jgi:hypothetical protein
MRDGSSQMRFKYGAGRLIGLFRREAMCAGSDGTTLHSLHIYRSSRNPRSQSNSCQNHPMPSTTYSLFRNAILGEQHVVCNYDGRPRELCPHIIGTNKRGEEVVLAWQFASESSGPLPQCVA